MFEIGNAISSFAMHWQHCIDDTMFLASNIMLMPSMLVILLGMASSAVTIAIYLYIRVYQPVWRIVYTIGNDFPINDQEALQLITFCCVSIYKYLKTSHLFFYFYCLPIVACLACLFPCVCVGLLALELKTILAFKMPYSSLQQEIKSVSI